MHEAAGSNLVHVMICVHSGRADEQKIVLVKKLTDFDPFPRSYPVLLRLLHVLPHRINGR